MVVYRAFDADLAKAKTDWKRTEENENSRHFEVREYEGRIQAIKSRRDCKEADKYHIYVPDLEWKTEPYNHRHLVKASLSKL